MLKLLIIVPLLVGIVCAEHGGLFREYKEDLNEYLTSAEVDRLVYGNDESVISEKIKLLPDGNMSPPGVNQFHLPMPTMDPSLDSLAGPVIKKLPPQRNNFMSMMKTAARMLSNRQQPRAPRQRAPIPQFRARPSTLTSSQPDQLEVAFKRIEIMASRAGLNMSSMPRRTQMQIIKRLSTKLPPRMSQLMKTTMEHNSAKLYDYLPDPVRDPLIEDDPELLSILMNTSGVTMDGANYDLNEHHTFEYAEPTAHDIIPTGQTSGGDQSVLITDHQPGTDYSIPTYDSALPSVQPFGFSAPPAFDSVPQNEQHSSNFGQHGSGSSSVETVAVSQDIIDAAHALDLKPVAAPLIGDQSQDVQFAQESENLPTILSLNSPKNPRTNKSLKVNPIKTVTPSAPLVRVQMPTKDKIKMPEIRVSIITKDNSTNINPFVMAADPVFSADVKEIKHSEEEVKQGSMEQQASKEQVSTAPAPTIATTTKTTTTRPTTTTENTIKLPTPAPVDETSKFVPMPSDQDSSGLLLKELDDYIDDQDLTSSELMAELKKVNSDYANSLELDYPLAPHPLEYPDHPDHPDNSDSIHSTATTLLTSPRPTMQQQLMQQQQREEMKRPHLRPLHGHPRPPMRPRVRPPPGPGHGPHRPNRPPPRRPLRPVRPPLRINEVTVSQIPQTTHKECDYFSEDLCLVVQDYPIEAISEAMTSQPEAGKLLVKEPSESSWVDGVGKNQEGGYNFKHYYGEGVVNTGGEGGGSHRHRDFAGEGGFLCPSKVAYGRVKKGKSYTSGEWKYIVNYDTLSQTLRLEKCLSPGNSCSYVMPHYRTACTQVYNYHRLLAWDSEKGLHMDVFKIPTCCTCHVQGYYIPGQQQGMTPARRRDMPPKLQYSPPQMQRARQAQQQKQQALQQLQQKQQVQLRREQQLQAQQSKQQQTNFNAELHELLTQYSSLRERIAKKKNERNTFSYSVSYSNSTKENSKRESSNQDAPGRQSGQKTPMQRLQRAMLFSIMKKIKKDNSTIPLKKKLTHYLKAANLTSTLKPVVNETNKPSHFNGTAHRIKNNSRTLKLQKLANLLNVLSSRKNGTGKGSASGSGSPTPLTGSSRRQGQRSLFQQKHQKLLSALQKRQGRQQSQAGSATSKLDKLKLLLNRSILKNRNRLNKAPGGVSNNSRAGGAGQSPGPMSNKRLQLLQQLQQQRRKNQQNRTKHRLRISSKQPSKVNYSYHPIMDYFGGKAS